MGHPVIFADDKQHTSVKIWLPGNTRRFSLINNFWRLVFMRISSVLCNTCCQYAYSPLIKDLCRVKELRGDNYRLISFLSYFVSDKRNSWAETTLDRCEDRVVLTLLRVLINRRIRNLIRIERVVFHTIYQNYRFDCFDGLNVHMILCIFDPIFL